METTINICQSCGMPLDKDPNQGGTNADNSKSDKYCSFCYQHGKFTDEGITLQEKIENNIRIACILTTEKQTKEFEVSKHTTEYLIINKLNEKAV